MTSLTAHFFSFGLLALAACSSGSPAPMTPTTPDAVSNTLCGRQRDNDQRCNPTRSTCLRQATYTQCTNTESLYRPELTTLYLNCYPATLACNSGIAGTKFNC